MTRPRHSKINEKTVLLQQLSFEVSMSYLEQLKDEAQARQKQEQAQELLRKQQQAQREKLFRTQVKPALEQLRRYLREMIEQLNILKLDTRASYKIKGYDDSIDDFQQQDYRVLLIDELEAIKSTTLYPHLKKRADSIDTSDNIILRCKCKAPYKLRIKKHKKREVALQKEYFVKHHIRFTCDEETDANFHFIAALFIVELVIFVEFEFVSHFETSTIDLTVTNFTELGQKFYTLQPKEINNQWLDELAKYILREPNNLLVLREKNRVSHQWKNISQLGSREASKTPSKKLATDKKPTSAVADYEEFDEWVRTQEQKLAAAEQKVVKKKGFFGLFNKEIF